MTSRLGLKSWATGALVLAAVTACANGGSDPTSDPTPTVASSSPSTPSSSATATDPSDAATTAASATMREYFAVVDALAKDPKSDLKRLGSVATSTQLRAAQTLLRSQRDQGRHQTGDTNVAELTVQTVNLDNSDPKAGKVPTVVIDVCWDVSKVDVLDKSGASIVSPDRPDTGWTRYTVANYHFADNPTKGWRVATGQDLKQSPCSAS